MQFAKVFDYDPYQPLYIRICREHLLFCFDLDAAHDVSSRIIRGISVNTHRSGGDPFARENAVAALRLTRQPFPGGENGGWRARLRCAFSAL